jgi:hypothetical protein
VKGEQAMKPTTICFDMDGTIANLYKVKGWLNDLENHNTRPYREAEVMMNMQVLARRLNILQKNGYRLVVISWLSKSGNAEYNEAVAQVKREWLQKHLASVHWDEIHIVEYGTPKSTVVNTTNAILFDDEERNRTEWKGQAYTEADIMNILKTL